GMTEWFVARLPEHKTEQGARWGEIHREGEALVSWLGQVPLNEGARVERVGTKYAIYVGPFPIWGAFCEKLLVATEDSKIKSDALWTLCQVAERAGDLEKAMMAAEKKARIDRE